MWERTPNAAIASDVAQRIDITARAGDSIDLTFVFFDPTDGAFDLSEYDITFTVVSKPGTVLALASEMSGLSNGGVTGRVSVQISPDAADFPPGQYRYLLTATATGGEGSDYTKTWLAGGFNFVSAYAVAGVSDGRVNSAKQIVRIQSRDILVSISNNS
jgi:hypothetical protein